MTASPSTPAGTVPLASTLSDCALHARPAGCGGPTGASITMIPSCPLSSAGRAPRTGRTIEGVGVVGDQHHRGTAVLASALVDEVQVRRCRPGAARLLLSSLEQRAQFRVAVAGSPDRIAVDPERDVVQKRATVHVAQIDRSFQRSAEGVERADEIVRRDADIAGEVVARTGGDAHKRYPAGSRDRCHDRQNPSPPATPRASAPPAATPWMKSSRPSLRARVTGSMPRSRARSASLARCALPRPEVGLMNSTGRRAASTGTNPDGLRRGRAALIACIRRTASANHDPATRQIRQVDRRPPWKSSAGSKSPRAGGRGHLDAHVDLAPAPQPTRSCGRAPPRL